MVSRLVLLMPEFNGYDSEIFSEMRARFDVADLVLYRENELVKLTLTQKIWRKFNFIGSKKDSWVNWPGVVNADAIRAIQNQLSKLLEVSPRDTTLVVIKGWIVLDDFVFDFHSLKKSILYLWDPIEWYPSVTKHFCQFTSVISFQAEYAYSGVARLPMYFQSFDVSPGVFGKRNIDLFYWGSFSMRRWLWLFFIFIVANRRGLSCKFGLFRGGSDYIGRFLNKLPFVVSYRITSSEVRDNYLRSKCAIEIAYKTMGGSTQRVADALRAGCEILTNNKNLSNKYARVHSMDEIFCLNLGEGYAKLDDSMVEALEFPSLARWVDSVLSGAE